MTYKLAKQPPTMGQWLTRRAIDLCVWALALHTVLAWAGIG